MLKFFEKLFLLGVIFFLVPVTVYAQQKNQPTRQPQKKQQKLIQTKYEKTDGKGILQINLPDKNLNVNYTYNEKNNLLSVNITNKNYTNKIGEMMQLKDDEFLNAIKLTKPTAGKIIISLYLKNNVKFLIDKYDNSLKMQFYIKESIVTTFENHESFANISERFKKKEKIKVIIDPGHGGRDPGAVHGNLLEKDIVLKLAKLIETELKSDTFANKFEVILTRDKDIFLSLNERRRIVQKNEGDIFISLHVNMSPINPNASGTEIFFVTEEGAEDVETEMLVKRENIVDINSGHYETVDDDNPLSFLFMDLTKRAIINQSIQLALNLEKSLKTLNESKVRHIRRAPFMVLKTLLAPAALIEIGFISNENDRKLLESDDYLKKYAAYLVEGINAFYINTLKKIEYPFSDTQSKQ